MSRIKDIFFWYFTKKMLPYWCIILLDCAFVFFSLMLVYTLNSGVVATVTEFWRLCGTLLFYLVFYVIGFRMFHTYSGIIRYSSFVDLQRVSLAMGIGIALCMVAKYSIGLYSPFLPIRTSDMLLGSMLALLLMWGLRVSVKFLYDTYYCTRSAEKIFILGVRECGVSMAKSIRNQVPARFELAGFTTDGDDIVGKMLMGVKVYKFEPLLISKMKQQGATALFVSPLRSDSLRHRQDMVDLLIDAGIKIYMMPSEQRWDGKSDIGLQMMREVAIEDLLPRQQIEVDMEGISRQLEGKRILITGAAGSIGSEIVRQVATFNPDLLVLIDQAETPLHDIRLMMQEEYPDIEAETIVADIAHRLPMEHIFKKYKPQYVFHAAAYKHVPMMENNPAESIRNNVDGTRVIADLAVAYGVDKFVMVSTDKAVNPSNVMGCSKRICEIYVQSLDKAQKEGKVKGHTQFVTTRFGNVLGSNGSVIPIFHEQIKKGGPLKVTHPEIIRYFMLIPEACLLVLEAATMGHGGEIFVFDMGEPVKIVDLARRMITLSGRENIKIEFTGLRHGEKLYEEVLGSEETTMPTFHPKIKIARVKEYDFAVVSKDIAEMIAACQDATDDLAVVSYMKKIVPEFISKNSKFQVLD